MRSPTSIIIQENIAQAILIEQFLDCISCYQVTVVWIEVDKKLTSTHFIEEASFCKRKKAGTENHDWSKYRENKSVSTLLQFVPRLSSNALEKSKDSI